MAKDVGNDLRWRTAFDLAGGMGVAKYVRAKEVGADPCGFGVLVETMADRCRAAQRAMWHVIGDEDVASVRVSRTLVAQVPSDSAGNRIEERQHRHDASLWTPEANRPRLPIDIVELQFVHLAGSHPVCRHHEKQGEVSSAKRSSYVDRA